MRKKFIVLTKNNPGYVIRVVESQDKPGTSINDLLTMSVSEGLPLLEEFLTTVGWYGKKRKSIFITEDNWTVINEEGRDSKEEGVLITTDNINAIAECTDYIYEMNNKLQ